MVPNLFHRFALSAIRNQSIRTIAIRLRFHWLRINYANFTYKYRCDECCSNEVPQIS